MDVFKINGRRATPSEWEEFKELSLVINPSAQVCFEDNKITFGELKSLFDIDNDQKITCLDFKGLKPELFEKLKDILQRHNYKLPEGCEGIYDQWADREFVLVRVKFNGIELQHADCLLKKDKEIALVAIEQNVRAFEYVDESLKEDKDFVLAAIDKTNGSAFAYAGESLKKDKEFILAILKQSQNNRAFWVFSSVDESLKKDREFVLTAIELNNDLFGNSSYFANWIWMRDKEFVLAVVKIHGEWLRYVDYPLQIDKDIVLAAIEQNGDSFTYAGESLKKDREFILAVVKRWSKLFPRVDEMFKSDREIALAAVKQKSSMLRFVGRSLREDVAFICEALGLEVFTGDRVFSSIVRENAWKNILILHSSRLLQHFNEEELEDFETFQDALKTKYNIAFIERFSSIEVLLEVLDKRKEPIARKRKTVLIIYPTKDWNGSFKIKTSHNIDTLKRLWELGFDVMYYEAATEGEARDAMEEATQKGTFKVNVIILGGHGTATRLALGSEDPTGVRMTLEKEYIDTGDFPKKGEPDLDFGRYIVDDGDLILESCSNGEGREENISNLANTIARRFKGLHIQSSDRPAYLSDIRLIDDRLVFITVDFCISGCSAPPMYRPAFNLEK